MPRGRPGRVEWTKEMDGVMRQFYPTLGSRGTAEKLGIDWRIVQGRARTLGLKSSSRFVEWTPEIEEVIRTRYQTDGPKRLAKELGIPVDALTAKSRRIGVGLTRKEPTEIIWTKAMVTALQKRYVAEGGDGLAEEFGYSIDQIRKKASELGLHTIAGHARAGRERAEKGSAYNIHYFDEWKPNMAYVLGFLFADGCVNSTKTSITVTIVEEDDAVLEFIRRELGASDKLIYKEKGRYDDRTGNRNKPRSTLVIGSTVLVEKLIQLGLKPRKTYNDDPFPEVPDEVFPHFVRGYLDGDGTTCISTTNRGYEVCTVGFVGSPRFLTGLRDKLVELAGMRLKPVFAKNGKTTNWATLAWTANKDVRLFREFVYPEGYSFCYERKKVNLDRWVSLNREEGNYSPWTDDEEDQVRNLYHVIGPTKLAELLDRDLATLHWKVKQLGLKPINRRKGDIVR